MDSSGIQGGKKKQNSSMECERATAVFREEVFGRDPIVPKSLTHQFYTCAYQAALWPHKV